MRVVTIEDIIRDEETISNFHFNNSTNRSYVEFLEFFQQRQNLTAHDIIIGAYFSYGWMPRGLNKFDVVRLNDMVNILNRAKQGRFPGDEELQLLKTSINNSLVGPSKLLHFINPFVFAIWDSRVFYYIERKTYSGEDMGSIQNYKEYHNNLAQIVNDPRFTVIHNSMNEKIGYNVSNLRACEYVMYMKGTSRRT